MNQQVLHSDRGSLSSLYDGWVLHFRMMINPFSEFAIHKHLLDCALEFADTFERTSWAVHGGKVLDEEILALSLRNINLQHPGDIRLLTDDLSHPILHDLIVFQDGRRTYELLLQNIFRDPRDPPGQPTALRRTLGP